MQDQVDSLEKQTSEVVEKNYEEEHRLRREKGPLSQFYSILFNSPVYIINYIRIRYIVIGFIFVIIFINKQQANYFIVQIIIIWWNILEYRL